MTTLLKFRPMFFPVEWKFQDPDTGAMFKATSKEALVKHIVTYRAQNNLTPIDSLDTVLENYLCRQPINAGGCHQYQLHRSLAAYVKGGMVLIKNLIQKTFVPQTQADERAAICLACPHNFFPDKGAFLAWSDEVAEIAIGSRRSKHHNELGNCQVCSCPLRSKVWSPPPFDLPGDQIRTIRESKPDCWQLPENYQTQIQAAKKP